MIYSATPMLTNRGSHKSGNYWIVCVCNGAGLERDHPSGKLLQSRSVPPHPLLRRPWDCENPKDQKRPVNSLSRIH